VTGKRILILNYEYPPLGGGAGAISAAHAELLAQKNCKITVITCSENQSRQDIHHNENLRIVRLSSKRKHTFRSSIREKLDWMQKARKFVSNINPGEYDYCMAHFSIPGGWVARHLKKKTGIPYGVISHGQDIPWFYPRQMFFYHLFLWPVIKSVLKHADKLWVQSQMMYNNAAKFMGSQKDKIEIIPNGCYTDMHYEPADYTKNEPLKLLFAGRLTQQKRPDKLIDIAVDLHQRDYTFTLTIAGDGEMINTLKKKAKGKGIAHLVNFTGLIPREQMPETYRQHHILLSTSEAEGMSISILEALFSGNYVLCTPVSGNAELIANGINGEVIPGDIRNFADAVSRFRKNPPEKNIQKKFHRAFCKKYNWSIIVQQYHKSMFNA
jgi:glycosyltransferase involved in cell wall biosynthesis